jgi:hypothetical protein
VAQRSPRPERDTISDRRVLSVTLLCAPSDTELEGAELDPQRPTANENEVVGMRSMSAHSLFEGGEVTAGW